jgi:PIN domain nuclease of toxin-antitoxin system
MRALLDTGVWFRRYHRLPISPALRRYLDEVTEFYLSPLSVAEISFKWQRGKLPQVPDPRTWVAHAMENFILIDLSSAAALQAGSWPWTHGDLVDRNLAAISAESDLTLVHTDKVLRDLEGFPQKWFKIVGS